MSIRVCVMGPSAAGKTSLIKWLCGYPVTQDYQETWGFLTSKLIWKGSRQKEITFVDTSPLFITKFPLLYPKFLDRSDIILFTFQIQALINPPKIIDFIQKSRKVNISADTKQYLIITKIDEMMFFPIEESKLEEICKELDLEGYYLIDTMRAHKVYDKHDNFLKLCFAGSETDADERADISNYHLDAINLIQKLVGDE